MSRPGRYVIDTMKIWASKFNLKMPVPPYDDVNYWEGVYRTSNALNDPPFEWGNISCNDLLHHTYTNIPINSTIIPTLLPSITLQQQEQQYTIKPLMIHRKMKSQQQQKQERREKTHHMTTKVNEQGIDVINIPNQMFVKTSDNGNITSTKHEKQSELITTTLGELMGNIHPNNTVNESILVLGCGTSPFGENLIENKWKGPVIQVDCSSRLIEMINRRNHKYIQNQQMIAIQDDATVLSAINDNSIHTVWDKGLMDALFCTDSYQAITDVLSSVHRVLLPNGIGTFCTLSLSHPKFLLPKLLPSLFPLSKNTAYKASSTYHLPLPLSSSSFQQKQQHNQIHRIWSSIEIRLIMDYLYCYRFTKK